MKTITFNLNDFVLVQLTDSGKAILKQKFPTTYQQYQDVADHDGYWKFQAWDFIHLFGPFIYGDVCNFYIKLLVPDDEN